jgi:acetamidase/formamidase/AraC-like DNA-binding protein
MHLARFVGSLWNRTMRFKQFTTESYPVHQRLHVWSEALSPHRLQPVLAAGHVSLYGTLSDGQTSRGVGLARIASSPQALTHLRSDADQIWVVLHQAGDASWSHGDSEPLPLAPGDIIYGSARVETRAVFHTDFRQFRVSLPSSALQARLPQGGGVVPGHLSGRSGMGRLLAGTLGALADALDTVSDEEIASVEHSLSELVASSLAMQHDEGPHSHTQAATLRRVCQFIEGALSDPELTLATVAAHERISERLVQKLFEGMGLSFTAYLRQRRLERCRAELANRQYGHLSISDICFRWGFNDAAHFSHVFRDRYQMSPRQFRQQANEASQQTLRKRIQRGWPSGYFETPTVVSSGEVRTHDERDAVSSQAAFAASTATGAGGGVAGRHHHLAATAETIHWGYFSHAIPPALTIASGDIVTIETLTQHAYDDYERMIKGDSGAESVFHWTKERKAVNRRGAGPADASIYGRGSGEGFGVHILTGPVAVEGAEPGDVLEVRILDLAPRLAANAKYEGRAFGSNAAAWWGFHYEDLLEEPRPREVVTIYEVDCNPNQPAHKWCAHAVYNFRWTPQTDPDGVVHPTIDYPGVPVDRSSIIENHEVLQGVQIPVRPHFGVIALAPAETGLVDSVPPSYFGGNLDNWRIAKGAKVFLRVAVDGGLLSVGDPHASQGDSELCGTAIECSLTGVFQIILHKAKDLSSEPYADIDYPLVETADEWVLHGFSHPNYMKELGDKARSLIYEKSSLDPAMRDAFRKTRRFLMTAMGLTEDEAISLMSVAVDFGVTQVVDGNWGVHAVIRKSLFAGRKKTG